MSLANVIASKWTTNELKFAHRVPINFDWWDDLFATPSYWGIDCSCPLPFCPFLSPISRISSPFAFSSDITFKLHVIHYSSSSRSHLSSNQISYAQVWQYCKYDNPSTFKFLALPTTWHQMIYSSLWWTSHMEERRSWYQYIFLC